MKTIPVLVVATLVTTVCSHAEILSPVADLPAPGERFTGPAPGGPPTMTFPGLPPITALRLNGLPPGVPYDNWLATTPAGPPVDSFFDIFYEIELLGQPPLSGNGVMGVRAVTLSDPIPLGPGDTGTRLFETEMLQLDLVGLGGPGILLRESPTQPSSGQTTVERLGDGQFHIDSFFDVFTELSLDGGQSWQPQQEGSVRIVNSLQPDVPEASTWAAGIAAAGMVAWSLVRRHRSGQRG